MLDFLRTLDRRWVFMAMLLAVAVPILAQKTFPEVPTLYVRNVFDAIERLPEGSTILLALDYQPASDAELGPMATGLMRHCCLKHHKMVFLTLIDTGGPVIEQAISRVITSEFGHLNLRRGEDFVNLGYTPGREVVIAVAAQNLRASYPNDSQGVALDDLPLTRNITNLRDFDMIVDISTGVPGFKEWVQYAASPFGIPMAAGTTAVGAPQAYPYIPGQMLGLLAAIKGAAEYEAAMAERYPQYRDPKKNDAIRRMAPQFWGHLLVIALIVLGNGIHFADRWRRGGGAG